MKNAQRLDYHLITHPLGPLVSYPGLLGLIFAILAQHEPYQSSRPQSRSANPTL
jgi:hypothetical protein